MATLDLNIYPYELYVNTSLEKPYHPYTIGLNNAFPDLHSTNDFLEPISDSLFHELDDLKNTFNSLSLDNDNLVKSDKFISLKKKFTKLNTQNEKNN